MAKEDREAVAKRRVEQARNAFYIAEPARDRLTWYLGIWLEIATDPWISDLIDRDPDLRNTWISFEMNPSLESLDRNDHDAVTVSGYIETAGNSYEYLFARLEALVQRKETQVDATTRELIRTRLLGWRDRLSLAKTSDEATQALDRIVKRAEASANRAEKFAEATASAAGEVGASGLSHHFSVYADKEGQASARYRVATIVMIAATFVLALVFPFIQDAAMPTREEFASVAYHLALILALGALATYLGRQSAIHRRNATWGRALSVQLDTFPAFVAQIENPETLDHVYSDFARRVMGAPPESSNQQSEDVTSLQTLRDLAALVNKQ